MAADVPREMVPFGLSETDLGPAFVDFAQNPHVVAVGRAQSGRTNFLRVMMRAIMARYSPDEATIVLIDPRRRLVGVVPEENWLSRYAYTRTDIATVAGGSGAAVRAAHAPAGHLAARHADPPVLDRPADVRGHRRHHLVDVGGESAGGSWPGSSSRPTRSGCTSSPRPTSRTGATCTAGPGVLGRMVGALQPTLILDGRRENGPIISGVYAEPQRPGKGLYVTASGTEGVLVAWSPPPVVGRAAALTGRRRGGQKLSCSDRCRVCLH